MKKRYAEVIILTSIGKRLTYLVPNEMEISIGSMVEVFMLNRSVLGIVSAFFDKTEIAENRIKPIKKVIYKTPIITPDLITLSDWMKDYYAGSAESVYETMIPAVIRKEMEVKTVKYLRVIRDLEEKELKMSKKGMEVYLFLKRKHVSMKKSEVLKQLGVGAGVIKGLVEKKLLEEVEEEEERVSYDDELAGAEEVKAEKRVLMEEQRLACEDIVKSLDAREFRTHLLHGVTGSGKTEVYLEAIEHVLKRGGSVIFLVPEVALTPQTVGRIRSRIEEFGHKTVVWHSQLSNGERFDGWMSLARGDAKVVVGARSAIFAPMPNLELIVVDEEHEPAFKQGESPRYHGRDVAVYRAKLKGITCILGSATPSCESLFNVKNKGYRLNKLTKRVDNRELPLVHVIDMKPEVLKARKDVVLSRPLIEKLMDRLEKGEQSILFINRRGYTARLICPECEYVGTCKHCSVSLTYHRTDNFVKCHICGYKEPAPRVCPVCRSEKIKGKGMGTQKIEDVVGRLMPKARIVRMDADTMSKKNLFREILGDFRKGKIDILIGTQMIAKGLDFPNVTLVGLVDADISLHMQDFRAGERTFQLIVQVAGRAGRGERAGEVVIQSFTPHAAPIQFARRSDFDGFLEEELEQRKEFNYPPYRHLIRHIFRSQNLEKMAFIAESWAKVLEKEGPKGLELRGPAAAPLEKIKDYYRYHLWIFTNNVTKTLPRILELREKFKMDKDVVDVFDVDPVDMA